MVTGLSVSRMTDIKGVQNLELTILPPPADQDSRSQVDFFAFAAKHPLLDLVCLMLAPHYLATGNNDANDVPKPGNAIHKITILEHRDSDHDVLARKLG